MLRSPWPICPRALPAMPTLRPRSCWPRFAEELLVDYPETREQPGHRQGQARGLKSKLSDRSAAGQTGDRTTRREAAGALEGHRHFAAQRSSAHRCGRRAHGARVRGRRIRLPVRRFGAAQYELGVSQRALRRRAEHRRVPGNTEHAGRAAQRRDAGGCGRVPGAARSVCRSAGRRNRASESAAAQNVIAPDFLLDKTLAQIKIARGGKIADWSIVHVAREAHEGHAGRLCREGREDRDGQSRAGARSSDRRAGSASQARDQRCRRVEAAARRRVLHVGLARRHDDADDARANSHDGPGRAARSAVRDGWHPEEAGSHARNGRRAHDCARQGSALPVRRQRRRSREGHGVSQRSHQRHSQAAAARVRDTRAGQHGDQAHGAGGRAGRTGRLRRPGHDRRQGAGEVLDQPRHDGELDDVQPARRWRITSRSRATYGKASTRSSCR